MNAPNHKLHLLVLLTYAKLEDGGKKIPALSGDRAFLRFSSHRELYLGILKFIDTEFAFAGDVCNAEVTLLDAELLNGNIYEGLDFEFLEVGNVIGRGTVKKIWDRD